MNMDLNRRTLISVLAAGAVSAPALADGGSGMGRTHGGAEPPDVKPAMDMRKIPSNWFGKETIAILIYDGMTALDVIGPQYFLSGLMGSTIHMVAKDLKPITSDSGVVMVPSATFETCPRDLDILLAGGGIDGTLAAMSDTATIDFLADRGARAKWVTSVCTGSLLLGQAGLLRGYRATSHWISRALLGKFGATEVDKRVVFDRNRATAAGVSAGIDLGLMLMQRLRPLDLAQTMQLVAEYAPEPPLSSGTPDTAPAAVTAGVRERLSGFVEAVEHTAKSAR
jgi:cyclohexyl-isocyanide hydratase